MLARQLVCIQLGSVVEKNSNINSSYIASHRLATLVGCMRLLLYCTTGNFDERKI